MDKEIRALRALKHPLLVSYTGLFDSKLVADTTNPNSEDSSSGPKLKMCVSMGMEYVPGGSLASLLRNQGPVRSKAAWAYTAQVLHGLDFLHRNGVAHFNLKGMRVHEVPDALGSDL